MGFFDNMRKPKGKLGNIQLKSMNKEHTSVSLWGLKHLSIKPDDVNHQEIYDGKVKVLEGNVAKLPFEDNTFDIVTAFETIYFWPDIEKCFGEVKRVLKPGGTFLIGMESNGSDNLIMKFWKRFIDMELYTDEEISSFLRNNNYSEITAYIRDGRKKQEIIKSDGKENRVNDDYSNVSFSDKFVDWVTVVARK